MLNKRIINTGGGGAACTTDTTQILSADKTESLALYRFEDNVNDTSNSTGKFGKGAAFNGTNASLDIESSTLIQNNIKSFSFWFKRKFFFGFYDPSSATSSDRRRWFITNSTDGSIKIQVNNDQYNYQQTGITEDNNWHHLAVIDDGKIYLDGNLLSNTFSTSYWITGGTNGTSRDTIRMGSSDYIGSASISYVEGLMDQLRFFNKTISASEVTTLYNETSSTVDTLQILGDTSCVATYRFEGNAQDLSGNYYHGSASNVVYDYNGTASNIAYATGLFGKAASFNPSNTSHINIDNLDFPTNNFTVSVWVYLNYVSSSSGYDMILTTAKQNSGGYFYFTFTHNVLTYYDTGAGASVSANTTVVSNQWYHCVLTKSSSTGVKLYLNNVVVGSNSGYTSNNTSNTTSGGVNTIGWYNTGSSTTASFDGLMDQFRIFEKALTAPEINSLYNETATSAALATIDNPTTLAYYKMADATDETGSYDGTATNVDFNVQGKYGFAGKFTGSSKIVIPSDLGLRDSNVPLTFSLWINFDDLIGNGAFRAITGSESGNTSRGPFAVNLYGTSSGGIATSFERYYSGLQYYNTNYNTSAAVFNYTAGVWYHLCFVYTPVTDGTSTVSVYINGSQSGITNPTYTLDYGNNRASANNLVIGVYSSSGYGWKGKLDQIRIFNRAISAAEVTTLYNEVQCANTITAPESYFNTKLFTPTTSTSALPVTGVGFSPDLAWAKYRGTGSGASTQSHYWYDTVRGINSRLFSSSNSAESTYSYLQSFDSDGVTYVNNLFNRTGANSVVGWFWKAGGITNKSALFNGSNSNINLPITTNYSDLSISCWVKFNALPTGNADATLIWKGFYTSGTNTQYLHLRYEDYTDQFKFAIRNNNTYNQQAASGVTATTGVWYHVVGTLDSSGNAQIYVNGNAGTGITSAPTMTNSNNFEIGSYASSTAVTNGFIDQVRIFNKELTSEEVTTLYNETSSTINTLQVLGDTSCIAAYPLGINANDLDTSTPQNGTASNVVFDNPGHLTRNNNGTIESTVNASQESGFSIVQYTGNGTAGSTVGHGLGVIPSLIIWKNIDATSNWLVYSPVIGNDSQWLYLNGGNQAQTSGSTNEYPTNKVDPTSSVVTVNGSGSSNNINIDGEKTIMYCFANIDGYQRIGSYVGTGTPENFIYTGFEPAWLSIKNLSTNSKNWVIVDNKRDNADEWLYANSTAAYYDDSNTYTKFYANGFSVADNGSFVNTSGDSYLFWAIAANPDTTAPTKANSFNTVIYTGDGGTNRQLTGVGFKPDFTWIKQRNADDNHALFDSVRGVNLSLSSNLINTTNDRNDDSTKGVNSFDDDGVTLGSWNNVNGNNDTYVAWNWKALDHDKNLPKINNDGSIPSLVSANIAAGFSIVFYQGNASSGATVGHGLGGELDFLIVKSPNLTQAWNVYVKGVTDTNAKYFRLNESNGIYTTSNPRFIVGNFNDNVFSLGDDNATNGNNDEYIAYCFRSITGYSKVGTYTGQTSGLTITTGFRPSFILIKSSSNTEHWSILDTVRGTGKSLNPNRDNLESDSTLNTFTVSDTGFSFPHQDTADAMLNENGYEYIYLAIA